MKGEIVRLLFHQHHNSSNLISTITVTVKEQKYVNKGMF